MKRWCTSDRVIKKIFSKEVAFKLKLKHEKEPARGESDGRAFWVEGKKIAKRP